MRLRKFKVMELSLFLIPLLLFACIPLLPTDSPAQRSAICEAVFRYQIAHYPRKHYYLHTDEVISDSMLQQLSNQQQDAYRDDGFLRINKNSCRLSVDNMEYQSRYNHNVVEVDGHVSTGSNAYYDYTYEVRCHGSQWEVTQEDCESFGYGSEDAMSSSRKVTAATPRANLPLQPTPRH